MTDDEYIGIVTICGDEGTYKTTMGLTFPKPLSHLDIDVGGYRRAGWRFEADGITSHSFPKPLTPADIAKMKGLESVAPSVRTQAIPKKVEGMKELWQKIIDQIVDDCINNPTKSIILDSATLTYKIACDAYLQELQEKQLIKWKANNPNRPFDENDFREKLQPMEYGSVYDRLQRIFHTSRTYQRNLILIHYPTDEYGMMPDGKGGFQEGKTGKTIIDGYKETAKFSDLVVWTHAKEIAVKGKNVRQVVAKITKCGIQGMGSVAVGMEIEPSYEAIVSLKNLMTGGKGSA